MSRIGKAAITIPAGVEVKLDGDIVSVKGPKGQLQKKIPAEIEVKIEAGSVSVKPTSERNDLRKYWGLSRTLIANMVEGVHTGYKKTLTLIGVGYRAAKEGKNINFTLGYSHPIIFEPVEGIELNVVKQTTVEVTGASKEDVGEMAAKIRALRPPEPYHGKGVRYADEVIITKVGKASGKK